jgi:hypothetical protein
MDDT